MAPITAISAHGTFFRSLPPTMMTPSTAAETARVVRLKPCEVPECVDHLRDRPLAAPGDAEEPGELPGRDLDADAGEKPDENGPREEVRKKPEPQHASEKKVGAGEEGEHPGERHVL